MWLTQSNSSVSVQYNEGGISLRKHAAMLNELEKILGRPVDLVEEGTLRSRMSDNVNQERKLIFLK